MFLAKSNILSFIIIGVVSMVLLTATTAAHVVVRPSEVVTASYQTFIIGVPNEKELPTTTVELLIPSGVESVTPTKKANWQIATKTEGEGDAQRVTSITWSGGSIEEGLADEFTFSAKVPDQAAELKWKAYQTYGDGTVVSWDKEEEGHGGGHDSEDENSGPLSVTAVTDSAGKDDTIGTLSDNTDAATMKADIALYLAAPALLIALGSLYFASRKK